MGITLNRINDGISRGIDFLCNFQLPDGEFPSYRTDKKMGPADWLPDSAVFPTTLVAHSLRHLGGSHASEIRNRAKRFLLGEMRPPGVWTYWSSKSGISIPPDLDDTCCAAALLMEDRPEIYRVNASIILNNRNQDGLFFTWLNPPADHKNDIDSVVNANVLFYLKDFTGIEKVVDHLYTLISTHQEDASYWYYLSPAALYYMIARAYAGGVQKLEVCSEAIAAKIIQDRLKTGRFSSATETALDLCTLLNVGIDDPIVTRPAVEFLIDGQHETGSWPRERFYAGPPPPGPQTVWFGSEAVSTAFCLEAFAGLRDSLGRRSNVARNLRQPKNNGIGRRRFRAYNVGLPKTGTTSIAGLLARYRTKHEFMLPETTRAIADYKTGVIAKKEFINFLYARDQRGNLEMDSASFNFNYLDLLAAEFEKAKFIATIRDCYSWLDSVLNNLLQVSALKDRIIEFGSRTYGVDLNREMFASRQDLVRALPDKLDGILNYWAEGLRFTMNNLPPERSLVIKTSEISDCLGALAGFLGIPQDSLIRENRHFCKAPTKFNILHDMDFNLLNDKFEAHCGSLMRKYFPEQTLADFLGQTHKQQPIKPAGSSAPTTRMSWGSDQAANLIFELIDELQIDYKFERSVKILQKKLLGNRFMIGIYKSHIESDPREQLLNVCHRMHMPEDLRQAFSENLSDAEGVGFGFEENEDTRIYKVYLDFMAKWKHEVEEGPQAHDPFPSILGFKWDIADNTKRGLATYTWYPFLSYEDMGGRISEVFVERGSKRTLELVHDFLKMAALRIAPENILYLDVPDSRGRSRRFDINMYRAGLQLKKMYPLLQKILKHYSIPVDKFHPLYNLLRTMKFGHLSGGIDKAGQDFLTIYFGIERIGNLHPH